MKESSDLTTFPIDSQSKGRHVPISTGTAQDNKRQ